MLNPKKSRNRSWFELDYNWPRLQKPALGLGYGGPRCLEAGWGQQAAGGRGGPHL